MSTTESTSLVGGRLATIEAYGLLANRALAS
jgi:hypothetical protein